VSIQAFSWQEVIIRQPAPQRMVCREVVHKEKQNAAQYVLALVNAGKNHDVWVGSATMYRMKRVL